MMNKIKLSIAVMALLGMNGCGESGSNGGADSSGGRKCSEDGLSVLVQNAGEWSVAETCAAGCADGNCLGCTPNESKCEGDVLQVCSYQRQWVDMQTCDYGCSDNRCNALDLSKVECVTVEESVCDDNGGVKTCQANHKWKYSTCENGCSDGKCKACTENGAKMCEGDSQKICNNYQWETTKCPNGCDKGECRICSPGAIQCSGKEVQSCSQDYVWEKTDECSVECVNGACVECIKDDDCKAGDMTGISSMACTAYACVTTCKSGFASVNGTCSREIPFAGNGFVTGPADKALSVADNIIDYYDGTIKKWSDPDTVLSFYFYANSIGKMKVSIRAALPSGTESSTIALTYNGETHDVTVTSTQPKDYEVGEWNVDHIGHVKIDIKSKSVKPNEGAFAKIESFFVGGGVVEKDGVYTTVADVQKKDDTVLYNRRGPYGCLFYNFPTKDDYEWFYNEVVVPDGQDTEGIYFQFAGSSASYMGIQRLAGNKGKVLFSVWSSYVTDDPNQIPADYTVTVLRKGENVTAQNFGGEGSGMQSWLDWDWKTEKTYKALVRIHPNGDNTTDFTGYFGDENGNWHLMAEFRRPKHDLWYKVAYAFVEVFDPKSGHITRSAYFTNTWGRTKDGQWHEVLNTQFHEFYH